MITPDQIKAARKLLGWSAATLAKKADRSLLTIAAAESSKLRPEHEAKILLSIRTALEAAAIDFTAEGVRLSDQSSRPTALTAAQIQEARRLLGWSLNNLSDRARMGVGIVKNAEQSTLVPRYAEQQLAAIRKAFEAAGIEFTGDRATINFRTGEVSPPEGGTKDDA